MCLQIQAILQNANVFNKSFNYIMTKQLFEAVWDEFGSVQQSDQIKAIKGPRIAEFSARACWKCVSWLRSERLECVTMYDG